LVCGGSSIDKNAINELVIDTAKMIAAMVLFAGTPQCILGKDAKVGAILGIGCILSMSVTVAEYNGYGVLK
jgi:alcohol dehydrogenase YqhD (iron-dependent ADH family)